MPRINANRAGVRGPRLIGVTPSAPTARNMLAPIGQAIEAIADDRRREAEEERERADRIAVARAESAFLLNVGRGLDEAAEGYDGATNGFADSQAERYDAAVASALEAAPEGIQGRLEERFAGPMRARHLLAAMDIERSKTGRYVYQGFLDHVDASANAVNGEPGFFPDALASIEDAVTALPEELQAGARDEAIGQVSRSYAEARLNADAAGFLSEIEGGSLDAIFPAEVRRSYASQAQAEMDRRERAAAVEARQAAAVEGRVLARMLDDAEDAAEQGFSPAISFEAVAQRAAALGNEDGADLQQRAIEAASIAQMGEELRVLPLADLEQRIVEERSRIREGASGFEARRIAAAERVLSTMRSELSSDPVAYARRTGVGDLPDLDFSSLDGLGGSLADRVPRAQAVADHYGVERQIFTGSERLALSEAVSRGDLDRASVAQSIVASLGRDAPAALQEIAPDEPLLATVGGLMTAGAPTAARDLAQGYQLRDQEGFASRLPSRSIVQSAAAPLLGGLAERLPNTSLELVETASAIYEARALRTGVVQDGEGWPRRGERMFEQALHEAAGAVFVGDRRFGGLEEHRGEMVMLPNWLSEGRLDDVMRLISEGEFGPPGAMTDARGSELSAGVLRRARLQSVGDQRYLVIPGRGDGVALDDAGAPFVLDLSAYRNVVSRDYPDWVR